MQLWDDAVEAMGLTVTESDPSMAASRAMEVRGVDCGLYPSPLPLTLSLILALALD